MLSRDKYTDILSKYFVFLHKIFKRSLRHVSKTSSRHVFKTSSRRLARGLQDVFKTSSRPTNVCWEGLEYDTISVINSLVSTTSFISYTFGMLLSRPILEAKFSPSHIKLEIILLHLAKTFHLELGNFATTFDKCDTKLKPSDYTFFIL